MRLNLDPAIPLRHEVHFGDRVIRCFAQRAPDLWSLFTTAAQGHREHQEALVSGSNRWSYANLESEALRVAAGLARLGVGRGDRVAMLMGNRPEFVFTLLGILRLGAIAVPIGNRLQTPEIAYIIEHCRAVALVHDAELADRLPSPEATPSLAHRSTEAPRADEMPPPACLAEEDTAVILYTSGTTGRPKGAMLTHLNIVHSALHFLHAMSLRPGDRSLLAVPASHVTGLVAVIVAMWQTAGATVLMPEFKASEFIRLAARERITHTLMVPAMYKLCLLQPEFDGADLSTWRIGGYGGAPMPESTIAALASRVPALGLINAYGATETTSPATLLPAELAAQRPDSVGLALPCADIVVMDDRGRQLAPGEPGELWIRGPMVVPGYWNDPEATAAAFTAGYWHSGDLGSVDGEGHVRVFDRIKDMLNRGGYKIFSVEVENVLSAHPGVLESAIVGRPCPVLGERVHAFVTLRDPQLNEPELRAFCAQRLADYKVPETMTLLDEPLPRNANGKLLKRILRERLLNDQIARD
jgi:O-succinylbenzoic acid--CoA ligase